MSKLLHLNCHPDTPCGADIAIVAQAHRDRAGGLSLRYGLSGEIGKIRWPEAVLPRRTARLWRTTCFEAFVRRGDGESYVELNFAPSGAWAAYDFSGYRQGMTDAPLAPVSDLVIDGDRATMTCRLATGEGAGPEWQVGLSAVIEAIDGSLSYWALRHPPGKPDFHHADCFALRLAAGEGA